MIVNGETFNLKDSITLKDFLTLQGYDITRVAVEKNGDIVPKATFSEVFLYDEDTIEVVRFVGGG
ncbi:MAG: sulfur carrier protein ThiS [Ruminococcus sp.]|nr:sulfur carrier protein ThiS [Ruminococcus sp.]